MATLFLPVGADANPADIIVDTTSDVADFGGAQQVGDLPGPDGKVSLREAITAANNTAGPQVIGFAIPLTDPGCVDGVCTIRPVTFVLPPLADDRTTIDGSTQTSFAGDPNPAGPEIEVDGSLIVQFEGSCQGTPGVGSSCSGLYLASDGNRVHRLVINGFVGNAEGVRISGSRNVLTGSYIGLDPTGAAAVPNNPNGVSIDTGNGNRVGGRTPGERNVISGNVGSGIQIASSGNVLEGNFIGTDAAGTSALGNGGGVLVNFGAERNIIGGSSPGAGNVISANQASGVFIGSVGGANANTVEGNQIGTDVTGTVAHGNGEDGVRIVSDVGFTANRNTITENLIAHNAIHGVGLFSSNENVIRDNRLERNGQHGVMVGGPPTESSGNSIRGNSVRANGEHGVIVGGSGNSVRRNSVQANGADGILLISTASSNSVVENFLRANLEHDCHDDSVGSGTAGTANRWRRNDGETSQPPGLCVAGG